MYNTSHFNSKICTKGRRLARLRQLLNARGWTEYRLSKNSGLSESTLANIFKRNTMPSIATLEAICNSFGITLSQFFAEGDMVELTPDLQQLFDKWVSLTPDQKEAVYKMISAFSANNFYKKPMQTKRHICVSFALVY